MVNKYGCNLMPQQRGLTDPETFTNEPTTLCYNSSLEGRREGTPAGRTSLRKSILLYWEAVVQAHSVVDTAARQQHGRVEIA